MHRLSAESKRLYDDESIGEMHRSEKISVNRSSHHGRPCEGMRLDE